jgi:hypothetical protein
MEKIHLIPIQEDSTNEQNHHDERGGVFFRKHPAELSQRGGDCDRCACKRPIRPRCAGKRDRQERLEIQ